MLEKKRGAPNSHASEHPGDRTVANPAGWERVRFTNLIERQTDASEAANRFHARFVRSTLSCGGPMRPSGACGDQSALKAKAHHYRLIAESTEFHQRQHD